MEHQQDLVGKKNEKKKKMAILIPTLIICFGLLAIAIYAALSQTMTVSNEVQIRQDGKARVDITIGYKIGEKDGKLLTVDDIEAVSSGDFEEVGKMEKDYEENHVTLNIGEDDERHLIFSEKNNYTYGAYKITFANSQECDATFSVRVLDAAGDSTFKYTGLTVYYMMEDGKSLSEGTEPATEEDLAKGETAVVYVVLASKNELDEIKEATLQGYVLEIVTAEVPPEGE